MTDMPTSTTEETGFNAPEPGPAKIPSFVLYKVDGRGRVNLSGVIPDGAEFYTATTLADGVIALSPVQVATTAAKRSTTAADDDDA